MSISNIRFRAEGALIVLQVQAQDRESSMHAHWPKEWRDATVEDLLAASRFFTTGEEIGHMKGQIDSLAQFVYSPKE